MCPGLIFRCPRRPRTRIWGPVLSLRPAGRRCRRRGGSRRRRRPARRRSGRAGPGLCRRIRRPSSRRRSKPAGSQARALRTCRRMDATGSWSRSLEVRPSNATGIRWAPWPGRGRPGPGECPQVRRSCCCLPAFGRARVLACPFQQSIPDDLGLAFVQFPCFPPGLYPYLVPDFQPARPFLFPQIICDNVRPGNGSPVNYRPVLLPFLGLALPAQCSFTTFPFIRARVLSKCACVHLLAWLGVTSPSSRPQGVAGRAVPVQVERPTGRTTWMGAAWSARLVRA